MYAAGGHRRHTIGEFHFAHTLHFQRTAVAIIRAAFHIHRGLDVVPGFGVGHEVVDQVAVAGAHPQVVVRVDDGQRRIDDVFAVLRAPLGAGLVGVGNGQ